MKAAVFFALLLPAAAHANYAECLLSKLPGTANDIAANAIVQVCQTQYPAGLAAVQGRVPNLPEGNRRSATAHGRNRPASRRGIGRYSKQGQMESQMGYAFRKKKCYVGHLERPHNSREAQAA